MKLTEPANPHFYQCTEGRDCDRPVRYLIDCDDQAKTYSGRACCDTHLPGATVDPICTHCGRSIEPAGDEWVHVNGGPQCLAWNLAGTRTWRTTHAAPREQVAS